MAEHIYLLGSEDVKAAAHVMTQAAETMQRAASFIEDSVSRLERLWRYEIQPSLQAPVDTEATDG